VGTVVACGSLSSSSNGSSGGDVPAVPSGSDQSGGFGAASGAGGFSAGFSPADAGVALPPETEAKASFQLPQAGQHYVYVANPDGDTVAVIDAATLAIQTVEAGDQPRYLQTLAGTDSAVVLNVGSNDATIIRTANGVSTTTSVKVQQGSNAIAVAPDGKHAVAYFDETLASPTDQPGSFQDLTVVSLDAAGDTSTPMTVGFRPSAVFFSDDGTKGFVVTQAGVSVLDFADIEKNGASIAQTIALGAAPTDQSALDVSVTGDGKYALAREENGSELRLVDLSSGTIATLDLAKLTFPAAGDAGVPADAGTPRAADGGVRPGDAGAKVPAPPASAVVTDLDLAPSSAYAMAVLRDRSTALRIPIPGAFTDPTLVTATVIPDEIVGSVTLSPGGHYALLYTTAVPTYERLTILDLTSNAPPRTIQLEKSVEAIAISPDDQTALVVHQKLDGDPNEPGIDLGTKLDRQYGYSVVAIAAGFPKLEVTAAPLGPFAAVPDGSHLFILFNALGLHQVDDVDLRSLLIATLELGSPPVSVGPVPATNRVFVGQDHTDGRISFIDWTTGAIQSVTGFELNSRIRQ
jgi:YVTN family beta-propeller protein